jgi:hypothetical protein
MTYKLKSLKAVIIKIIRDFGLGHEALPMDDMYEWCAEALHEIGAYTPMVEKEAEIVIENYQGKLPCDFGSVVANPGLSFKIVQDTITTKKMNEVIKFKYLAQPLCEDGYPLVPDSSSFDKALTWKVGLQLAIRDELKNKNLTIDFCLGRWNRYCGQARAEANFPDADGVERFKNVFLNLKPHTEQYNALFKDVDNAGN